MKYREFRLRIPQPELHLPATAWRRWLPAPGSVLFTLLCVGGLLWGQSVGALSIGAQTGASTGTIAYQGRLADASGNPLTQTVNMVFRLYAAADGGVPLWEEQWTASNGVQVSDGLFNVMLGSLTSIPTTVVTGNDPLFLGISVGTDDEMAPRVQLGSVPFAVQALTVPDGSITQDKLSSDIDFVPPDGSITQPKAPFAPRMYRFDQSTLVQAENPVIVTAWFHGGDDGVQTYDFSAQLSQIDGVTVVKSRNSGGNSTQVTFMATDASGVNPPTPASVQISAFHPDTGAPAAWMQGYVTVIGR